MVSSTTPLIAPSSNGASSSYSSSSSSSWTKEDLATWRACMQETHESCANLSYKWRAQQLNSMRRLMEENEEALTAALKKDLGKGATESICTELQQIMGEIKYFERNLKNHMKPQKVASPGVLAPSFTWIEPRPLLGPGVLVIGPSNYPVFLSLQPAIGSLAAGNPTIIKPSEHCPAVSQALSELIPKYLEPSACRVVLGGAEQTKMLLEQHWGMVFFTGSATVGRLVAEQAARTLTPTCMELGGKCPCYIDCAEDDNFDWDLVANRIIWARTLNAGQTCAAVDYVVAPKHVVDKLLPFLVKAVKMQFGEDPYKSELGRIVKAKPHAQRLLELILEAEAIAAQDAESTSEAKEACEIILGGSSTCRVGERYICPTLVKSPRLDSRLMTEEIFGPILPIISVENREEGVKLMKQIESSVGTPLCLYVFTKSEKAFSEIIQSCRAGSVMRNDALVHLGNGLLPFGGLGKSGYGAVKGPYSFQLFTKQLPCMYRPCLPGSDLNYMRYHPFTGVKTWVVQKLAIRLPYIPVIPTPLKLTVGLTGLFVVLAKLFPIKTALIMQPLLTFIAEGLERTADYLKGQSDQ
mmetsp:Transcript_16573/g.34192  ORF Transcript_16573/g.34192 Transcript_16573/m.34192 type:complete len:581 (-) Transcript_16573:1019-2761(-)